MPVKQRQQPTEGEVLKVGPPAAGEIVITVDARRAGSAFAMGTETLLPGAEIPLHRHLQQDEVMFVHKGQGRAVLEGRALTVVPGTVLFAPKQAWHSLRNTGTGLLQITWTSAPPGIEAFFRELSRLSGPADATTLEELAKRHGIEFPAAGQGTPHGAPRRGRHRHRRGGNGRGRGSAAQPSQGQPPPKAAQPPEPVRFPLPEPRKPEGGRGPRQRHGPRQVSTPLAHGAPPQAEQQSSSRGRQKHGVFRHRRGHVKEVYMGGRWIRVVGEGPVIAPGRERPAPGRKDTTQHEPSG